MIIHHVISFYPDKERGKPDARLRCRIKWKGRGNVFAFLVGYRVTLKDWDSAQQRCKRNSKHGKLSAQEVNARLEWIEATAHKTFDIFERNNELPTAERFKDEFNSLSGLEPESGQVTLGIMARKFLSSNADLSDNSIALYEVAARHFVEFAGADTELKHIAESTMESYMASLNKQGISNTTSEIYLFIAKKIMKYAASKGFYEGRATKYRTRLKGRNTNPVIALTLDEMHALQALDLGNDKRLEAARDLFIFCCHTGIRYSDMQALEHGNIRNGILSIIEKKTSEKTEIPLSATAKGIIGKYKGDPVYALPRIRKKDYVDCIRILGELAGIDTPVQTTTFIGTRRIVKTAPKWQYLGSHTARKTFITTALSLGIPVTTVMSMSGHNSFEAMKRYIAVSDDSKAKGIRLLSHALDLAESESKAGNETGNEAGNGMGNGKHPKASMKIANQDQEAL